MTTLSLILMILQEAAAAAGPFLTGKAGDVDALAASLMKIIQAALAAREQVTGQPIDLDLLKPIQPLS